MEVRASAPGKLMLFGEYAALDGGPALALCVDRRIACTASLGEPGRLSIESKGVFEPGINLPMTTLDSEQLPDSRLALLWPLLRPAAGLSGLSLRFEAEFPPTWGLGSSTASSLAAAAVVRAMVRGGPEPGFCRGDQPNSVGQELLEAVLAAQEAMQGAASGYDAATQLLGGWVHYQRDPKPRARALELPDSLTAGWLVGYTGHKAKTASMIDDVRKRHPRGAPIYGSIAGLCERVLAGLSSADRAGFGAWLNEGHAFLRALGAVPDVVQRQVEGLWGDPSIAGARLSGAGGGDCILVLAFEPEAARAALERESLSVLPLEPAQDGLLYEE